MLGVFEVDQVPSLEPENPDPLELRFVAGMIVFFDTGIDASSAADTPGKFKTVTPQGIRESILGADLKFFSIFLIVPLLQLGNDLLFLFGRHLAKMLLQEILGFFLGARRKDRKRSTCQRCQRKITEKLPSRITSILLILHRGFLPDDKGEARALRA